MAEIRCKLTENGKSIASAEIHFESGDTILLVGQQPHVDEGSSGKLAVHLGKAKLHLSRKQLSDTPLPALVVGPEIPPGATPTNPNLPTNPKNPPPKHKGTAAG